MTRRIAFLRGINVGGNRKVPMADLRVMFEQLGFANVETYIQSGNVMFDLYEDADNAQLERKIEQAIETTFGFEVPAPIRTSEELERAILRNPFYSEASDVGRLHLTFLSEEPPVGKLEKLNALKFDPDAFDPDAFDVVGKEIYLYYEGKSHQSKLTNNLFEKKLGVKATTRNWKTVLSVYERMRQEQ